MANIRELGPTSIPSVPRELRPSEAGPQAERQLGSALKSDAAETGRVLGGAVREIGSAIVKGQDAAAQNEISTGTASYATAVFNQSQNWDNTVAKADPADMSIGQTAIDQNNQFWDNWANNFHTPKGQAFAATKAAEAKLNFQKAVIADNSTRAGYAAQANLKTYQDATVAHAGSNPDQLDTILAAIPGEIAGTVPEGADARVRAKAISDGTQQVQSAAAREALAKIAAKDPNFQTDWDAGKYDKYKQYLSPSEQDALPQIATTAAKARTLAANAAATAKEKAQKAAIEGAKVQLYSSLRNPDGSPNHDAIAQAYKDASPGGKLLALPGFTGADYTEIQAQIKQVDSGAGDSVKTDRTVYDSLQSSITDNTATEGDIWRAAGDRHLSVSDRDTLLGEYKAFHPTDKPGPLDNAINKQQYDQQIAKLEPAPGPLSGIKYADSGDTLAAALAARDAYQTWYRQSFIQGINAGYSPESMLFPNGDHYLDPQQWVKSGGSDPDKLLAAAQKFKTQSAPLAFAPGGNAAPAPTKPPVADSIHNPDGTLKITIPGLVPGGK